MSDYMTLLHKHKINGGFLAPDRIPMEERNKNEMILELQNEVHIKDEEIERLNNIINELEKWCLSLKENDKYCYLASNDKDKCRYDIWEEVLDKLQELKGVDKE